MVCLLSNDGIKIRILDTWRLRFIICLFVRNQLKKVSLLIKALIKKFLLCWTSFYIYFYNYLGLYKLEFIWTLFKIYNSDIFYLNLWLNICFLNNFANIHGYPWISTDMKKIGGYPHNGYLTDMDIGTGRIFIQRVGYEGATTRTLPAPLTSLLRSFLLSLLKTLLVATFLTSFIMGILKPHLCLVLFLRFDQWDLNRFCVVCGWVKCLFLFIY